MAVHPTTDQDPHWPVLARALSALGVRYLSDGGATHEHADAPRPADVATLIAQLASSPDARLRQALIGLFLLHPELSATGRQVADQLPDSARRELMRLYTGAVYLQRLWRTRLQRLLGPQPWLPPYWIDELGLPPPEEGFGRPGLAALVAAGGTRATRDREGVYGRTARLLFGQLLAERASATAGNAA